MRLRYARVLAFQEAAAGNGDWSATCQERCRGASPFSPRRRRVEARRERRRPVREKKVANSVHVRSLSGAHVQGQTSRARRNAVARSSRPRHPFRGMEDQGTASTSGPPRARSYLLQAVSVVCQGRHELCRTVRPPSSAGPVCLHLAM